MIADSKSEIPLPVTAQVKTYLLNDLERVSIHAQDEAQSILLTTRTTGEVDEVAICIYEGKQTLSIRAA